MRADIMKYVIHFAKNEQKHILRVQKRSPRDEDYWNATFLRSIFKKSSVTKNMIRDPRSTSWSEMTVCESFDLDRDFGAGLWIIWSELDRKNSLQVHFEMF